MPRGKRCGTLSLFYRAALEFPAPWSDELDDAADVERVSHPEWRRAHAMSMRLPLDVYREVSKPIAVSHEESLTARLVPVNW